MDGRLAETAESVVCDALVVVVLVLALIAIIVFLLSMRQRADGSEGVEEKAE